MFFFGLFCETKNKEILFCFGVSNLYRNNQNKQNCFKINRNNPKFSEKYQNKLSIKLFRLVFSLFWFNRNIETCCFGMDAKQPKQTVSKQNKQTGKTLNFLKKIPKYAPSQTVSLSLLLCSHLSCRYYTAGC
jgi:hypothetical protein